MKVLLTGGSGFLATHVLNNLLADGHSVVTSVRSASKGDRIIEMHPAAKGTLSYSVVEDVAKEGAFDEVFKATAFDAVIHTASPFHFKFDKPQELLDPAIKGTTGILYAIKKYAPTVRRVVITSSFAAIVQTDGSKPSKYDESYWNSVTYEEAVEDRDKAYRASKTLAEKSAWEFIEKEKPNFNLATLCPPYVFGPVVHDLKSANDINTSNSFFMSLLQGGWAEKVPPSGTNIYVDVRDVATAHMRAMTVPEAGGKRFFLVGGYFDMGAVADVAKKHFPVKLPAEYEHDKPADMYEFDVSQSKKVLGLKYTPFEATIVDSLESLGLYC